MVLYCQNEVLAFEELFRRHSGKVYGYILKKIQNTEIAQDLTQVSFLKLHEHRDKYLKNHPFLTWFFVIIKNSIIDEVRKIKPTVEFQDILTAEIKVELNRTASEIIDQAPESYREALHLRYVEEKDFEEIAEKLNLSPDNVRKKISRGLQHLRALNKKDSL